MIVVGMYLRDFQFLKIFNNSSIFCNLLYTIRELKRITNNIFYFNFEQTSLVNQTRDFFWKMTAMRLLYKIWFKGWRMRKNIEIRIKQTEVFFVVEIYHVFTTNQKRTFLTHQSIGIIMKNNKHCTVSFINYSAL